MKLFIYGIETISGTEHGKLVSCGFDLLPVYGALKFAYIKSFITHKINLSEKTASGGRIDGSPGPEAAGFDLIYAVREKRVILRRLYNVP